MPLNYKSFRKPVSRSLREKRPMMQPLGGAVPAVQNRSIQALGSAERTEFPAMAALIYKPPAIVHTPVEVLDWQQPGGMVDRLYQPVATKPRDFGAKIAEWFKSGRFE